MDIICAGCKLFKCSFMRYSNQQLQKKYFDNIKYLLSKSLNKKQISIGITNIQCKQKECDLVYSTVTFLLSKSTMKHSLFKIRSIPSDNSLNTIQNKNREKPITPNNLLNQHQNLLGQNQINEFFTMFKSFLKSNSREGQTAQLAKSYDLEVRDRDVIVEPTLISNEKISITQLKIWATKVMKTVSSAAFHYFSRNEMSFEQAKIYCSENILKNIVIFGQSASLTDKQFEVIDTHIKTKVLDYLSAKYPMTDSTEINKKLQETVHEVDNIQSLQNNYFANTDLIFQYRDDGNYNDLIMSMMNEIMRLVDDQSEEERTNYSDFREFISSLFQKVEDEDWVRSQDKNQIGKQSKLISQKQLILQEPIEATKNKINIEELKQKARKRSQEKEKYRAKVKQYTNYLIGRKIPEDAPHYSEKEIKSMSMNIKSSSVLRILTKWCEQLMDKFEIDNYYSERSESIKVQKGGHVNSLLAWMRKKLDQYLRQQREDIRKYMKELSENNYQMQESLLKYQLQRKDQGDEHVDQLEKISGKFSLKTVKNLHSYIVSLLNRLIHGLMKVAKRLHDQNGLSQFSNWSSPVNLLTFKMGDLMRCKCSSHEKQILHIYKELQRLSREQPQKLRIVRIKNRLRSGTNDILVNVKFKGKVMCEVQLAVKATTSNFIKCSNLFHHYFYELQRSYFGPLTELCSIWSSLDRKSQIYQQLIDAQDLCIDQNQHTCKKLSRHYEMVRYQKPFICGQCSRTYFHNNYLRNHSRCSLCGFFVCAKCQLSQESEQQQLISSLITDPKLRNLCMKRIINTEPLPELGACVFLESQLPKVQVFTHFVSQKGGKQYILSKSDDKIYQSEIIGSKKQQLAFRSNYIIFTLKASDEFSVIDKDQIRKKYLLPSLVKKNYQKEKQSISLMDQQLTTEDCKAILDVGTPWQKERVNNLFLADNRFDKIPFNPQEFSNLRWLTLSRNDLSTYEGIEKCYNLTNFIGTGCRLKEIPTSLFSLKNIQKLCFSLNLISKIPEQISNLSNLSDLDIDKNELKQLPQALCECLQLKALNIGQNSIQKLPENFNKLQKLQILVCNNNLLDSLPMRIGDLKDLKEINASYNMQLITLPESLYELSNLEVLDCSVTGISAFSENIGKLSSLRTLKFRSCQKITSLPSSFLLLHKLQQIDFDDCRQLQLPKNIGQLSHLKDIHLVNCNLNDLPQSLKTLKYLQTLDLSRNELAEMDTQIFNNFQQLMQLKICQSKLKKFPNLSKCKKLVKLNLRENKITEIPNDYMKGLFNIESFNIDYNQLKYFPSSILDFNKLTTLEAEQNKLEFLVSEKGVQEMEIVKSHCPVWPQLKLVKLYNNSLTTFPYVLLHCNKLIELVMSSNKISKIPPDIGNLINLQCLNMNYNQLRQYPKQISKMKKIERIYLAANKITKVEDQFRQLPLLKTLSLDDNPFKAMIIWSGYCKNKSASASSEIKQRDRFNQKIQVKKQLKIIHLKEKQTINSQPPKQWREVNKRLFDILIRTNGFDLLF